MRLWIPLSLALLSACATRSYAEPIARTSPASAEARAAALTDPAVSLREDPPLPDEPGGAPLWRGLEDPDAAVFPLPSEPGGAWGASEDGGAHHAH